MMPRGQMFQPRHGEEFRFDLRAQPRKFGGEGKPHTAVSRSEVVKWCVLRI